MSARETVTTVGGFLLLGCLAATFYAVDAWWVKRIREQVAERERQREEQFLLARWWRRMTTTPSPVALELAGDLTADEAADFLIWDSGCSTPRAEEA